MVSAEEDDAVAVDENMFASKAARSQAHPQLHFPVEDEDSDWDVQELFSFSQIVIYLWSISPSVQGDFEAMYIFGQEYNNLFDLCLKVMMRDWNPKIARKVSGDVLNRSMPDFSYAMNKMDFVTFVKALWLLSDYFITSPGWLPRAKWIVRIGNRITKPVATALIYDGESNGGGLDVYALFPNWVAEFPHKKSKKFFTLSHLEYFYDVDHVWDISSWFEFKPLSDVHCDVKLLPLRDTEVPLLFGSEIKLHADGTDFESSLLEGAINARYGEAGAASGSNAGRTPSGGHASRAASGDHAMVGSTSRGSNMSTRHTAVAADMTSIKSTHSRDISFLDTDLGDDAAGHGAFTEGIFASPAITSSLDSNSLLTTKTTFLLPGDEEGVKVWGVEDQAEGLSGGRAERNAKLGRGESVLMHSMRRKRGDGRTPVVATVVRRAQKVTSLFELNAGKFPGILLDENVPTPTKIEFKTNFSSKKREGGAMVGCDLEQTANIKSLSPARAKHGLGGLPVRSTPSAPRPPAPPPSLKSHSAEGWLSALPEDVLANATVPAKATHDHRHSTRQFASRMGHMRPDFIPKKPGNSFLGVSVGVAEGKVEQTGQKAGHVASHRGDDTEGHFERMLPHKWANNVQPRMSDARDLAAGSQGRIDQMPEHMSSDKVSAHKGGARNGATRDTTVDVDAHSDQMPAHMSIYKLSAHEGGTGGKIAPIATLADGLVSRGVHYSDGAATKQLAFAHSASIVDSSADSAIESSAIQFQEGSDVRSNHARRSPDVSFGSRGSPTSGSPSIPRELPLKRVNIDPSIPNNGVGDKGVGPWAGSSGSFGTGPGSPGPTVNTSRQSSPSQHQISPTQHHIYVAQDHLYVDSPESGTSKSEANGGLSPQNTSESVKAVLKKKSASKQKKILVLREDWRPEGTSPGEKHHRKTDKLLRKTQAQTSLVWFNPVPTVPLQLLPDPNRSAAVPKNFPHSSELSPAILRQYAISAARSDALHQLQDAHVIGSGRSKSADPYDGYKRAKPQVPGHMFADPDAVRYSNQISERPSVTGGASCGGIAQHMTMQLPALICNRERADLGQGFHSPAAARPMQSQPSVWPPAMPTRRGAGGARMEGSHSQMRMVVDDDEEYYQNYSFSGGGPQQAHVHGGGFWFNGKLVRQDSPQEDDPSHHLDSYHLPRDSDDYQYPEYTQMYQCSDLAALRVTFSKD